MKVGMVGGMFVGHEASGKGGVPFEGNQRFCVLPYLRPLRAFPKAYANKERQPPKRGQTEGGHEEVEETFVVAAEKELCEEGLKAASKKKKKPGKKEEEALK